MSVSDSDPWRQMVLDGLARIERRLDGFVTIETHRADLSRLDYALQALAADIGVERADRAEQQTRQDARINAIATALSNEADSRRKADEGDRADLRGEIAGEAANRKRDRQWLIASLIAIAGVVAAFAQVMLR